MTANQHVPDQEVATVVELDRPEFQPEPRRRHASHAPRSSMRRHGFWPITRRSFIFSGQLKHFTKPCTILFPVVPILLGETGQKISRFSCQSETLELDFGQSVVSLKVMIPYYESWKKILRFGIYITYVR